MKRHYYAHHDKRLTYFGRNLVRSEATYCNWTCSGVQFECIGNKVEAEWVVDLVEENGQILYPWLTVFVNGEEEPHKIIQLNDETAWYTLYESSEVEKIQIKVVKRTEAQHSKTALKGISVWGEDYLGELPLEGGHTIEFIGDSITCGYGNESHQVEDGFKTAQENGLLTYAAQVAKNLKADFQCVSVSGIGAYSSYTGQDQINDSLLMKMVYDYTDYFVETKEAEGVRTTWDFKKFAPELIVINLGTNDKSYLQYDFEERKESFKNAYIHLLKQVRAKNGPEARILCASMVIEPNMYDIIVDAVQQYQNETQDMAIHTMVFDASREEDGMGGNGHPTVKTHIRMAEKMTAIIKEWLEW